MPLHRLTGRLRLKPAAPGVLSIRSGILWGGINTAVHCYRYGDALIDTGAPAMSHALMPLFKGEVAGDSSGREPLRRVLVTHHHEDHAGNLAGVVALLRKAAEDGALTSAAPHPVYAPASALPALRSGYTQEGYRRLIWGTYEKNKRSASSASSHAHAQLPLATYESLPGGVVEVLPGANDPHGTVGPLVALPAPGHCGDHHVLYSPSSRYLFAGDVLVTSKPSVARFDECPHTAIDTLRRLSRLHRAAGSVAPGDVLASYTAPLPHESVAESAREDAAAATSDAKGISYVFCAHRGAVADGGAVLERRLAWLRRLRHGARAAYAQATGTPAVVEDGVSAPDSALVSRIARKLLGYADLPIAAFTRGDFSSALLVGQLLAPAPVLPAHHHISHAAAAASK